ncbi:hypothetical protein GCM10027267_16680 [Paramicrobacterium agarici]
MFDDLESQLDSAWSAEEIERRAEDERLRIARLGMRDRLIALGRSSVGDRVPPSPLRVILRCGREVSAIPRTFGRDWIAADTIRQHGGNGACLIALAGISSILVNSDDAERSLAEGDPMGQDPQITDRIGLPFVLRDLCRRRSYASLSMATSRDAIGGTIDRVARDHLDVARHPRDTPRRARDVSHVQVLALAELDMVEL